jgi:hypothetical protein
MSLVGLIMNLLLAGLMLAALTMGWRLNRRLQVLRDSHDGFEAAVRELNVAAARAEQGLADLRAATDEATDLLSDRIEKGRALALKLERLVDTAPPLRAQVVAQTVDTPPIDAMTERRLGALLAAARDARPERLAPQASAAARVAAESPTVDRPPTERLTGARALAAMVSARAATPRRRSVEDELFADEPLTLNTVRGDRA